MFSYIFNEKYHKRRALDKNNKKQYVCKSSAKKYSYGINNIDVFEFSKRPMANSAIRNTYRLF